MKFNPRIHLAAAGAVLALAATASPASAHTSATCVLDSGAANCLGGVAHNLVDPTPTAASMTVSDTSGHLFIDTSRMLGLFDREVVIDADLTCIRGLVGLSCSGQSMTLGLPIAVRTVGTSDGAHEVVTLDDGIDLPDAPAAPVAKKHHRHHTLRHQPRHAKRH